MMPANVLRPSPHLSASDRLHSTMSTKRTPHAPPDMAVPGTRTASATEGGRWQAVLARDLACDGKFVYAVQTTGIFCRPSCPSRRPARGNVMFFATAAQARAAGYRACRRCSPESVHPQTARVIAACEYLDRSHEKSPTLAELGRAVGMSPFALQRLFRRVLGVTPRQYCATRRAGRFREGLATAPSVTAAIYQAGYDSASPAYRQPEDSLGMRPAEYRKGGAGLEIGYTLSASPLGRMLVAATERGICAVAFGDTDGDLVAGLRSDFFSAHLVRDDGRLAARVASVLALMQEHATAMPLPLDVRATAFQWRVWQALRQVPRGETRSYAAIAQSIGQPAAVRAVARACGQNPVAVVIPCHRILGKGGQLTGYRWGVARKRQLLERERSQSALLESEEK